MNWIKKTPADYKKEAEDAIKRFKEQELKNQRK